MTEPLASRVLFPWTERRFSYEEYDRFLAGLAGREIVPLREFATGAGDLALRHDVDSRLESALEVARLEARRGLRATYFLLHTAPYCAEPDFLLRARELQDLGHEVGFHNDLVTAARVHGRDPRAVLEEALARLRGAGLEIVGTAAHGSPWCHRLGFHNNYVFAGWDEPRPGYPNLGVPQKLDPHEFGLEYEAYHVPRDAYFSDSTFVGGRRRHPASLRLRMGHRAIVLVHPDHWDRSGAAKWARLARKLRRPRRLSAISRIAG
jgi:hypothetical protein